MNRIPVNDPRLLAAEPMHAAQNTVRGKLGPASELEKLLAPITLLLCNGEWSTAHIQIREAVAALDRLRQSADEATDEWMQAVHELLAEANAVCADQIDLANAGLLDLDDARAVRAAVDRVHARAVLRAGGNVPAHMHSAVKREAIRESEVAF